MRGLACFVGLYLLGAVAVSVALVAVMEHIDGRQFPY